MRTFYRTHLTLPLAGSLPDMKAQSADYIALQNVYKEKARRDQAEVAATARDMALSTRPQHGDTFKGLDDRQIETFCKNAGFIKVMRGRKLLIADVNTPLNWGDRASYVRMCCLLLRLHVQAQRSSCSPKLILIFQARGCETQTHSCHCTLHFWPTITSCP